MQELKTKKDAIWSAAAWYGFDILLTFAQVDEGAQHFYRKSDYKDCSGFIIDIPKYQQPMEMFLVKEDS